MSNILNIIESRVYVCDAGKYAKGIKEGRWISLKEYSNTKDFIIGCMNLLGNGEAPIFVFPHSENLPKAFISRHAIQERIFELIRFVSELEETEQEAFNYWIEKYQQFAVFSPVNELYDLFNIFYQGKFTDKNDFARWHAREKLAIHDPDFQVAGYARCLFRNQFRMVRGHVFLIEKEYPFTIY